MRGRGSDQRVLAGCCGRIAVAVEHILHAPLIGAQFGGMAGGFAMVAPVLLFHDGAGRSPRVARYSNPFPFAALSSLMGLHRTGARRREQVARLNPPLLRGPVGGVPCQQVRVTGGVA